jgi:CHASE3 domain sensor protein
MRMKIAGHVWLLCALTLGAALVLAALYWQLLDNRHNQSGRARAEQALRELGELTSDIAEADSAEQSILYTGQEQYFDAFHAAVAAAKERLANLQSSLGDNADQARRLTELARLIDGEVADLRTRIGERQESVGSSRNGVVAPAGNKLTAQIRGTAAALVETEQALLAGFATSADDSFGTARTILLAGGPLLLIALAFAAAMTAGLIKRPLERIIAGGKSIAGGDFSHRIPIAGSD